MMQIPNPKSPRPAGQGLTRRATSTAVVVLAGSQLALAQPLTERVEHAVEIPSNARISIMNFAGHVEVHGTDPGEDSTLRVIGVKRLEAELPAEEAERIFKQVNLDLRRRGRRIHIGPNRPRGDRGVSRNQSSEERRGDVPIAEVRPPRRVPPVSVDLEVWLPDGASLEVRTFTAPITIAGISAPDGDFLLRSVSGPIQVRDLEVRDLRAETVSGDLNLADVRTRRGSFMTLTAPIRVSGVLFVDGWYEFQTHSGAVVLGLGSVPGFAVAATTYTGEIRNELEFETERDARSLEGRHGAGGPQISVSTFGGDIHLAPEAGTIRQAER
jgi:hypothetical protein